MNNYGLPDTEAPIVNNPPQTGAFDFDFENEAGVVANQKIKNASITSAKIGTAAIQTANIADAAITNAKIGSAAIGDANIGTVSANKISAGTITVAVNVGTGNITIDGANKRIVINDGTNDRILIGFQSGGF